MTSDELAIRALLDRQRAAWAAGDALGYAAVFTNDADYITFSGAHHRGRHAIAASYAPLFEKLLSGSLLVTEIVEFRLLATDVALIVTDATVLRHGRRRGRARVNTSIAIRIDGNWLLTFSQNTTRRPMIDKLIRAMSSGN